MGCSLVYHSGALGDFVTALPAIACWRLQFPQDSLTFLGRREHGRLARDAGYVDDFWDFDEARFSRACLPGHRSMEATLGRSFDRALLFAAPGSALPDNLKASGVDVKVQRPFPDRPQPIIEYHLSLYDSPPPPDVLFGPLRQAAASLVEVVRKHLKEPQRTILIHPGSGGTSKNWPLECFAELAGLLRRQGQLPVWCLGPAEPYLADLEGTVLRGLSLGELGAVMHRSRLFVGNDSGVAHLAAAVGLPAVVLFGTSDPAIWTPVGSPIRTVWSPDGVHGIPLATVSEAVREALADEYPQAGT